MGLFSQFPDKDSAGNNPGLSSPSSSNWLYIFICLIIIVLIGLGYFLTKKTA
jgi:hypothetical protein